MLGGELDRRGREGRDGKGATSQPVIARPDGQLAEVEAGQDERIENQAGGKQGQGSGQQPRAVLIAGELGGQHGKGLAGHRDQERVAGRGTRHVPQHAREQVEPERDGDAEESGANPSPAGQRHARAEHRGCGHPGPSLQRCLRIFPRKCH